MSERRAFALWITGLPGSGKSTITRELVAQLRAQGLRPAVLESDALRPVLTPEPTYQQEERDRFYLHLSQLAVMLVRQGLPVIIDATANRRAYRDSTRAQVPLFVEVFVRCPVEVCRSRDPKGLYASAGRGEISSMPGVDAVYEEPHAAEVVIDCREEPAASAREIVSRLRSTGII